MTLRAGQVFSQKGPSSPYDELDDELEEELEDSDDDDDDDHDDDDES